MDFFRLEAGISMRQGPEKHRVSQALFQSYVTMQIRTWACVARYGFFCVIPAVPMVDGPAFGVSQSSFSLFGRATVHGFAFFFVDVGLLKRIVVVGGSLL